MVITKVHKFFGTVNDDVMRRKLLSLLKRCRWNMSAAAAELGVSRFTIHKVVNEDAELSAAHKKARSS